MLPDPMNRDYVRQQVTIVLARYGTAPGPRGSGVGDVEYWCDQVLAHKGWEQYWIDRIGLECERAGLQLRPIPTSAPANGGSAAAAAAAPAEDSALEKLSADVGHLVDVMEELDKSVTGLSERIDGLVKSGLRLRL